jgi:hypothetical protein
MTSVEGGRAVRVVGVAVVLVGAVLALIAFRFLDWYDTAARGADTARTSTFSDLQDNADQLSGAGAATAYFDWLAWVLLITLVCVGVAANLPIVPADVLRIVGTVLGVAGVVATYFAVAQLHNAQVAAGGAHHNAFYNSTWGLWLTFVGFAVGAIGALLGPRRVTA